MGQIVTTQDKSKAFKNLLEKYKPQMALALPKHVSIERFQRMALNAAVNVPEILDCTPLSQIGALMQAATLGLEPGVAGECWILPFKDNKSGTTVATFIPGYRGLIQLCWRSNEIANIGAEVVYARDYLERQKFPPKLIHKEHEEADRGALIGAYAYAKVKGGTDYQWVYLPAHEILAVKKRSRGAQSKYSPWNTEDEPAMWAKTALRRLCKFLPMSVEVRKATSNDELADAGLPQQFDLDPSMEVHSQEETKPAIEQPKQEKKQPAPAPMPRGESDEGSEGAYA